MEIYKDLAGQDCVMIVNEDGAMHSMTKAAYDLSQVEHLTEIPTPSEA